MVSRKPFDFGLFITVIILLAIGITMIFSASSAYALRYFDDSYKFLKAQLAWSVIGFIALFCMASIDYRVIGKFSGLFLIGSFGLLVAVLIPGIGKEINGARRWIGTSLIGFQPSEVMKLALIFFFSYSLAKRKDTLKKFKGLVPYLIVIGIVAGLLMLEPHFSSTVLIGCVSVVILYAAGARLFHFVLLVLPVVAAAIPLVLFSPYRLERMTSFLNPWSDPTDSGWQIINSLYAIGSGGLFGKGLGRSLQKFLYIPEPHNDFIFSILSEELGFLGVITILTLFLIFIWRGVKISLSAPDQFGCLLGIGITSLIAIQVIVNIAVVSSSMPVTGMPLPFFSYGGTSLLFLMAAVGVLLNISRYSSDGKFIKQ